MPKILVLIIGVFLGVSGCGGKGPEEALISKRPLSPKPAPIRSQDPSSLSSTGKPLTNSEPIAPPYNPAGTPDPFQPPRENLAIEGKGKAKVLPLEQFEISDYELVGVVIGSGIKKAMVQDLTGRGFLVAVGTGIGKRGGKIIRIGDREIIIEEPFTDFLGRKKIRRVSLKIPPAL